MCKDLVNYIVKWSQETAEEKKTKKIRDARKKRNDSSKWEDLARKAMEYEEKETRLQEVGNKKRKVMDKKNMSLVEWRMADLDLGTPQRKGEENLTRERRMEGRLLMRSRKRKKIG